MTKIKEVLEYIKSLIGTPYVYWFPDFEDCGPMSYANINVDIPSSSDIMENGINCVGVINLMRRFMKLEIPGNMDGYKKYKYAGGTYAWYKYLEKEKRLTKFDDTKIYPNGTLLLRKYKNENDQGHVAVISKVNKKGVLYSELLHAYPNKHLTKGKIYPGLTIDKCVGISHFTWDCKGYYTHVCLPNDWLLKN